MYKLKANWAPAGDQPKAIDQLSQGIEEGKKDQVLMGVTGSGKTYTMANIIKKTNLPTLILAPNKTLAAQLFEEMKEFFPNNAVEYFISYYDYYQPEAYKPQSNTYIPKESQRNDKIDQLRHSATRSICESDNVIVVASISCIYGMGSAQSYKEMTFSIKLGDIYNKEVWATTLNMLQYVEYVNFGMSMTKRGTFHERDVKLFEGKTNSTFMVYPSHLENKALEIIIEKGKVAKILEHDEDNITSHDNFILYANTHHVVKEEEVQRAAKGIEQELEEHIKVLRGLGKVEEAERLEERVTRDVHLLKTTLTCPGVENYSRYFTSRAPGQPPPTLYEFFPRPFLCIADESHIMIPQIKAMFHGDRRRKQTLVEYGFRLPSCLDNRPLNFEEWNEFRSSTLFVSATPGKYEAEIEAPVIEQVIRPTGLIDPPIEIKPTEKQLYDAIEEAKKVIEQGHKVIMLTLTKKMSEKINDYLLSIDMKTEYLHCDVTTLARIKILQNLRKGVIDVVVGINLLREGIDIPECGLVIIFDADQEGYLRSQTSLIQMIGRAARNSEGRVILYADKVTKSMKAAIDETNRRRQIQMKYNEEHNITPKTTYKQISNAFDELLVSPEVGKFFALDTNEKRSKYLTELEEMMRRVASERNFDEAIRIRDSIKTIRQSGLIKKEKKKPENVEEAEITDIKKIV